MDGDIWIIWLGYLKSNLINGDIWMMLSMDLIMIIMD